MRRFYSIGAVLVGLLLSSQTLLAQFTLPKVTSAETSTLVKKDTVKQLGGIENEYFSEGLWQAERRRLRHERNTVELNTALVLNQNTYHNWAPGGDNTFSFRTEFFFRHQYNKEKFQLDYRLEAKYGINYIESQSFKNQDLLRFNASTGWKMKRNWSYAASVNFRTQFAQGFKSIKDNTLISDFMAPGILDLAVGFIYHKPKSPFTANLSPLGGSMTFVLNDELSQKGAFGVEKGRRQMSTLGSSIRLDLDMTFARNIFAYRSTLYGFTNYKFNTFVQWDHRLDIRVMKYLSATLIGVVVYDRYAETTRLKKLQYNYSIGLALNFRYKNK